MVSLLLLITFTCGLVIAFAHVINRRFVAPVYDVIANLIAFISAVAASFLLGHWVRQLFQRSRFCAGSSSRAALA